MSSTNTFDILVERMTTLNEMADSFKRTVKGVATGEDGLNLMLKAYRNEKTGKPVGAVSRVKNLIVLRALYDKDYINDEQFQALAKKATSSNYIANTLKEINPTAHEKLFGSAQESEDIIKHIKLNAKDMLNFGLTNLKGKSFVEVQEDEPEDIDAKELEDEVTDEVISLAKGLTSADVEGTILDFDDVDVSLDGVENKDAITRKLIGILNNAGYTAETTGAGFNVEAPIGSFGSEEQVQDLMAGLILKHFPGVDENLIDIKLNTTIEDAEVMNEPLSDLAKVGVEEVYPDDQAELPDDYHEDSKHAEDAEGMKKEFTFGYDLENVYEVMKYVKDNYVKGKDYEMTIGYGDEVMNHLEVKDGSKLLKDEHFLGLVDDCAGGGDFDEGDDFAEDAEGVSNGNVEVTKPCTAEIWSGRTQLKSKEYNPGDKIPTLSSRVEGNDVAIVTDDGVTMYLPVDCVSVEGEHAEDAEHAEGMSKKEFIAAYNDIISSGFDGFAKETLLELFDQVDKNNLKEWMLEMLTNDHDKMSREEIAWVKKQLGIGVE